MTDEQFYEKFVAALKRYEKERDMQPASQYAKEIWARVTEQGLFDGSRPKAPLLRQEAAALLKALREVD